MCIRFLRTALALMSFLCLFTGSLFAQPANDSLCNATALTVGAACTSSNGDLTGSSLEATEPIGSCAGTFPTIANSVWFTFVAPPSGLVMVSANFPSLTTLPGGVLSIYSMNGNVCSLDSLVAIACNRGEGEGAQGEPMPSVPASLTPGETYYVQISGRSFVPGLDQGPFCIQVEELQAPANDLVCDAIEITVDDPALEFSTVGATGTGEFAFAPAPDFTDFLGLSSWGFNTFITQSVWFKFTAPASGIVSIDLADPTPLGNFNSKVALFEGTDCTDPATFTLVEAQDNTLIFPDPNVGAGFLSMQNRWDNVKCLTPGATYYILVDGSTSLISPLNPSNASGRAWLSVASLSPDPLGVTAFVFDATCVGDTNGGIFASATGGAGAPLSSADLSEYTYAWSNGDSTAFLQHAIPGTTYSLTVTDACDTAFTQAFTVEGSDGPEIAAVGDAQVCPGESVALGSMVMDGNPIEQPQMYLSASSGFAPAGKLFSSPLDKGNEATVFTADTLPGFSGLTYAANLLWALSDADELFTIDPATGDYTLIDTISGANAFSNILDIDFNVATGQLVAVDDASRRYSVDLATAVTTLIDSMQIPASTFFTGLTNMAIDTNGVYYFSVGLSTIRPTPIVRYDEVAGQMDTLALLPYGDNLITDLAIDPLDNSLLIYHSIGERDLPLTPVAEIFRWSPLDSSLTPVTYVEEVEFVNIGMAVAPPTLDPYTYSWSPVDGLDDPNVANPVATVTSTTEYVVTISDACGSRTDTVTITVDVPTLTLASTPDNGTDNGTATATGSGGVAPYTFLWSNGETTAGISGLSTGVYSVTITDSLGCAYTDSVEVASNVSIDQLAVAGIDQLSIFPNPAADRVEITAELATAKAERLIITSSIGQLVANRVLNGTFRVAEQVRLDGLQPGIYMVGLQTTKGTAWQRLVVR